MLSGKTPCIICPDLVYLIRNIGNCKNNPEKSSTTKIGEHIPCAYSVSDIWAFDSIKLNSFYCKEDCVKKFFISLRKHAADVHVFL